MSNNSTYLFTESNFGGLTAIPQCEDPPVGSNSGANCALPPSFVESLGFPKDTNPTLLAQVLEDTRATLPSARVDHLRSPGVLCRLFSQSAADACYALAIVSIVESPGFEATLVQLKTTDSASFTPTPTHL